MPENRVIELCSSDMESLVQNALFHGGTDRRDVVLELIMRGLVKGFYRRDGDRRVEYSLEEIQVALEHDISVFSRSHS